MSFRYKIAIAIVAVEALVVAIVLWQSLGFLQNQLQQHTVEANGHLVDQLMKYSVKEGFATGDFDIVQQQLVDLAATNGIEQLFLFDTEGYVRASSEPERIGTLFNLLNAQAGWTLRAIVNNGTMLGQLAYRDSYDIVRQVTREALVFGLGIALVGLLLTAVVGVVIGAWLAERLEKIALLARNMRDGQVNYTQVDNASDEIGQLSRFIHDLGERISIHLRDLVVAEERFRLAIKAAGAGAWKWSMKNQELYWSVGSFSAIGYLPSRDKPTYELWRSAIHPDDRERVDNAVSDMLKNRSGIDIEYRVVRPNGQVRWMRSVGNMHFDYQENPDEIYGLQIDVTHQKELQERLREQKSLLQTVLDNSSDSVVSVDSRKRILMANRSVFELFGYSENELLGSAVSSLLNRRDALFINSYIDACLTQEQKHFDRASHEVEGTRKDGSSFKASISIKGLGEDNHSMRFVITIANLTRERRRSGNTQVVPCV